MRDKFPEFYDMPKEELWENCHFIFDTNIFINLYKKYPKKSYERFVDILENEIADRIWMPYQIGLEYQMNRADKIKEEENKLKKTIEKLKGLKNYINQTITSPLDQIKKIPFADVEDYMDLNLLNQKIESINTICDEVNEELRETNDKINFLKDDKIRNHLDHLFEDKIGDNYPTERLKEINEEGEYRYINKIPPGFKDKSKKSNIFGDLILWHQIMEYAESNNKDIIFVTDETKKDWWLTNGKAIICPHPVLIKEFSSITGQNIFIYKFSTFLDEAKEYLNVTVETEVIEAVETIEELQEIEEEIEESTVLTGPTPFGSTLQIIAQEAERQQKLIQSASSLNALQQAVHTAQTNLTRSSFILGTLEASKRSILINYNPGLEMMKNYNAGLEAVKRQAMMVNYNPGLEMMKNYNAGLEAVKRQGRMVNIPTIPIKKPKEKKNEKK